MVSAPLPAALARRRLAVALAFFVNGTAFASWVARMPALRAGLGLDDGRLGLVLFALSLGVLLSFPLAARGVRLLGARRVTGLAALAQLMLLPVPYLVHTPASAALALFELGLASGAMDVAMNVLAVDVQQRAGRALMSSLHGLWSAGGVVGAVGGSLAAHAGLAPAWHLAAVACLLGAALAAAARLAREEETVAAPAPASAPGEGAAPESARVRLDATLCGLGIVCLCAFLVEGALADWSAVYLRTRLGLGEARAALGYAVFAGAMMTVRLVGDRLLARVGTRFVGGLNGVAALALGLAVARERELASLAAFALAGLGLATVVPASFSAAAAHAARRNGRPDEASAAGAIAWVSGFGYTGLLAGPPVIGALSRWVDLRLGFGLLALLVAVIALLAPRLTGPAGPRSARCADCARSRSAARAPARSSPSRCRRS